MLVLALPFFLLQLLFLLAEFSLDGLGLVDSHHVVELSRVVYLWLRGVKYLFIVIGSFHDWMRHYLSMVFEGMSVVSVEVKLLRLSGLVLHFSNL
jgi:hypothetical protein